MDIHFIEGFESLTNTGSITAKYALRTHSQFLTNSSLANASTNTGAQSRWPGQRGLNLFTNSNNRLGCYLPSPQSVITVGMSWFRNASGSGNRNLIALVPENELVDRIIWVELTEDEKFQVTDDTAGILWTASDAVVSEWYTLELRATSAGAVAFRVNGTEVFADTGLTFADLHGGLWGKASQIGSNNGSHFIDDLVLSDEFTGGGRVRRMNLVSDIAVDFSRNAGDSNFGRLTDSALHDSDSSYVFSDNVTDRDLYGLADLPEAVDSIAAMMVSVVARKDNTTARGFRTVVRHDGNEVLSGENIMDTDYRPYLLMLNDTPGKSGISPGDFATPFHLGFELTT